MGREIRRVPPNWEHPKKEDGNYQPMLDESYEDARIEWIDGLNQWLAGKSEHQDNGYQDDYDYWEDAGNPPDRNDYRPSWTDSEMTWYQAYENVSEGTPITPPFPTKEALIEYLTTQKDFWGYGPYSEDAAKNFVEDEYAPSFIITADRRMAQGIETAAPEFR